MLLVLPSLGSDGPMEYDGGAESTDGLQGTWREASSELVGGPNRNWHERETLYTFSRGRFIIADGRNEYRGTYKVDPSRTPAHLDELHSSDGRVWRYIYQVEGDTLKIAHVGTGAWNGRPTSFSDDDIFIFTYKRVKK
jgi:uncharacterized protein (TIGR03067 family)